MLDFSKEIKLEQPCNKLYFILKIALYFGFIVVFFFIGHRVIFPIHFSELPLETMGKLKVYEHPYFLDGQLLENNEIPKNKELFFERPVMGNFNRLKVEIELEKNSQKPSDLKLEAQNSYRAMFLPEGSPISFKDGSLIKNGGSYYFISEGKSRKFSSLELAKRMGFGEENFWEAIDEEFTFFTPGVEIKNISDYPEGILVKIDEKFYKLIAGKLQPFISKEAYLSHYSEKQAVSPIKDFPISDEPIGFSDGSLILVNESVFLIKDQKKYPIKGPDVFDTMGFNWDDIITVDSEEASFHEKTEFFQISSIHPDNTVFADYENNLFYLIQAGQKHRILEKNSLESWLRKKPILMQKESLNTQAGCMLKKKIFPFNTYGCAMDIYLIDKNLGNNYHFALTSSDSIKVRKIETTFKRTPAKEDIDYIKQILANKGIIK